jgi:hypothetical protein
MSFRPKYLFLPLFLLGLFSACVEDYDLTLSTSKKILIVDGFLTDLPQADTFRIGTTDVSGKAVVPFVLLPQCRVSIQVDNAAPIRLIETPTGYYTPSNLRATQGRKYKLRIETSVGDVYESDVQDFYQSPPIGKTYDIFNSKGILDLVTSKQTPTNDVYVDFNDPANGRNFYLWKYIHFEQQFVCKTCENGILDGTFSSKCIFQGRFSPTYDYACFGDCFDLFFSNNVNVFSDNNSNGKEVKGRLVAQIPLYSKVVGTLVEIQQYNISADAYRFYSLLDQQAQRTGTLADTPPAAAVGNVRNINKVSEPVAGYFGVAGVSRIRYYIDRKTAMVSQSLSVPLLGREPRFEPNAPINRPPSALCLDSSTRKTKRPEGWPK